MRAFHCFSPECLVAYQRNPRTSACGGSGVVVDKTVHGCNIFFQEAVAYFINSKLVVIVRANNPSAKQLRYCSWVTSCEFL